MRTIYMKLNGDVIRDEYDNGRRETTMPPALIHLLCEISFSLKRPVKGDLIVFGTDAYMVKNVVRVPLHDELRVYCKEAVIVLEGDE